MNGTDTAIRYMIPAAISAIPSRIRIQSTAGVAVGNLDEHVLAMIEDAWDVQDADRAMHDPRNSKPVSWTTVKKKLKL